MKFLLGEFIRITYVATWFLLTSCVTSEPPEKTTDPQIENLLSQDVYAKPAEPFILYQFYRSECQTCAESIEVVSREVLGGKVASLSYSLVSLDVSKGTAIETFNRSIAPKVQNWSHAVWDSRLLTLNGKQLAPEKPYVKLESQSGTVLWSKEGPMSGQDALELKAVLTKAIDAFHFKTITPSKRRRFSALDQEVTGETEVKTRNQKSKKNAKPFYQSLWVRESLKVYIKSVTIPNPKVSGLFLTGAKRMASVPVDAPCKNPKKILAISILAMLLC